MFRVISRRNRKLLLVVTFLLTLVYFSPIWFIGLKAPQYRDGLSMSIWLTKITGGGEFDLKNINLLNHYVGMREIHAENFVEFVVMPYLLAFLILGALVTYLYPRRFMVCSGLVTLLALAAAGFYDFRRWEHEYGHNLDPEAALSIPGINFEPPLLGCKAMMNFNACSWPHIGAISLFAAGLVLTFIIFDEVRKKKVPVQ